MEKRSAYTPGWTGLVDAAHRIRTKQFVLDGEAVLRISAFDGLYSGHHNDKEQAVRAVHRKAR
jgi:hypothetical protein